MNQNPYSPPGQPVYPGYPAPPANPGYPPAPSQGAVQPPVPYPVAPVFYPQYPYPPQPVAPMVYAPAFSLAPRRPYRLTSATKTVNRMSLMMILQLVAAVVIELPLMLLTTAFGVDLFGDDLGLLLFSAAMVPLSTALPLFIYLRASRRGAGAYLRFEKVGVLSGVLWVLAGVGLCLAGNFPAWGVQEFFGQFGYEPVSQSLTQQQTWPLFALELLSTAVLVPVMEEFAFRGVIFSALQKHGTGFAVVVSALIFAFAHLDLSTVLFAFVAGLTMGFLYARTRNLWVTICVHALNNAMAVAGSYGDLLFGEHAELAAELMTVIPLGVGILALIVLLIFKFREIFRRTPAESGEPVPLTGGEGFGCVARAPLFWVCLSMVAVYTVSLFF